ncbi:ankyrin repeat and MYND domain-containing protein 1-like [Bombyx mandarina]|uniref:Ankyrin repeat and MYND domain-containing protein 1-like n=1 Tax=Bombyx mandarina TaxID=7092 RepID=A0A6J2JJT8_BOMMA|nr:ankyrin repeat and MYND domain-containing protein 1-like [Bombyx mandarina]
MGSFNKLTALIDVFTTKDKCWPYVQYYIGDKDKHQRSGFGENHWSGAISLECYIGRFVQNTMHGMGEYKWQHQGPNDIFASYEGYFYANTMHGYGTMSYADGRVFSGLYYNNMRWGPGIESHINLQENVGLWRGSQLIRLAWRPQAPSITLDLTSAANGKDFVESYRTMLLPKPSTVDEINSAVDLLKDSGCDPLLASKIWHKLYPKNCTNVKSAACNIQLFERNYYTEGCYSLEELHKWNDEITDAEPNLEIHYAWNNSKTILHIMKHCYRHENQRSTYNINIAGILSGQRFLFKSPGIHELNCRTLLMASYLGYLSKVAQLIMESNVHPDVADCQGNSTIMYATAGEQVEIIQFLVEAGADINCYNDSCCTPLGLALMKLLYVQNDIPISTIVQSLLPPTSTQQSYKIENVSEWNIVRETPALSPGRPFTRSPSKVKAPNTKKLKSSISLKDAPKRKQELLFEKEINSDTNSFESFSDSERLYTSINSEFIMKIDDLFQQTTNNIPSYLFEVHDMVKEVIENDEDHKKATEKNPKKALSKEYKVKTKLSKELFPQIVEDSSSITSADKAKKETLDRIKLTILQLCDNGADPCLVNCPQPSLVMAILASCPEIISELVSRGADINMNYSNFRNYTALDLAISLPFTFVNLEMIRTIMKAGGKANHLLQSMEYPEYDNNGPTLLHVVLSKTTESDIEEEIRGHIIALLLEHDCDPTIQFKGRSPMDIALSKSLDIFDIFVKSPKTNLNTVINNSNQNVLVKLFVANFCNTLSLTDRLQILTNLMQRGANPLLECYNGSEKYQNLFVFANKIMENFESQPKQHDTKTKKADKPKKEDKLASKSLGKLTSDEVEDYKQALQLVKEYAKYLHITWIQIKLVKELSDIVQRYKHRHWSMIIKEHKNWKQMKLSVTTRRCLEIWNLLRSSQKFVNGKNILKNLLCIVEFYNVTPFGKSLTKITAELKDSVEKQVKGILHEQELSKVMSDSTLSYVAFELKKDADQCFKVCFECAMPFQVERIECSCCKLVSFCCENCVKVNEECINYHPCIAILKK